jgi:hypothetical protein
LFIAKNRSTLGHQRPSFPLYPLRNALLGVLWYKRGGLCLMRKPLSTKNFRLVRFFLFEAGAGDQQGLIADFRLKTSDLRYGQECRGR